MIIVVTTVKQGGMPQFAIQIAQSLIRLKIECAIFVPESDKISINSDKFKEFYRFQLPDSYFRKISTAKIIAKEAEKYKATEVWFADETTTSLKIATLLNKNMSIKVFVHDVTPHIYSFSWRRSIKNYYLNKLREKVFRRSRNIVLMSISSKDKFVSKYPGLQAKARMLRLGADVSEIEEKRPRQWPLSDAEKYFMFFGCIEKYKNILGLLKAYSEFPYKSEKKLVIAGKGDLSEEEKSLIGSMSNHIVLINRFIEDSEMIYLFRRATATVLPYLEASQSGVLAMGYYFGVPTIVSDLPGLTENVINGETGFICKDQKAITEALIELQDMDCATNMGNAARRYLMENLDFTKNLVKILYE